MAVKYVLPNGVKVHGPPYTKAEEAEFYERIGNGPVSVSRAKRSSSIVLQHFQAGSHAFLAMPANVQVGWCRRGHGGWYVEDMDSNRLGGPVSTLKEAERVGSAVLAHAASQGSPGS